MRVYECELSARAAVQVMGIEAAPMLLLLVVSDALGRGGWLRDDGRFHATCFRPNAPPESESRERSDVNGPSVSACFPPERQMSAPRSRRGEFALRFHRARSSSPLVEGAWLSPLTTRTDASRADRRASCEGWFGAACAESATRQNAAAANLVVGGRDHNHAADPRHSRQAHASCDLPHSYAQLLVSLHLRRWPPPGRVCAFSAPEVNSSHARFLHL